MSLLDGDLWGLLDECLVILLDGGFAGCCTVFAGLFCMCLMGLLDACFLSLLDVCLIDSLDVFSGLASCAFDVCLMGLLIGV